MLSIAYTVVLAVLLTLGVSRPRNTYSVFNYSLFTVSFPLIFLVFALINVHYTPGGHVAPIDGAHMAVWLAAIASIVSLVITAFNLALRYATSIGTVGELRAAKIGTSTTIGDHATDAAASDDVAHHEE